MEIISNSYPIVLLIHILSVIVWLGFFPVQISMIKTIRSETEWSVKNSLVLNFLKVTNLVGMIGATGIVITGIILVLINPAYNFFEFKSNHWLTTKQFIILVILLIIFAFVIPTSKKLKNLMLAPNQNFELFNKNFGKLNRLINIEKILVLINFMLAFFHRFYF